MFFGFLLILTFFFFPNLIGRRNSKSDVCCSFMGCYKSSDGQGKFGNPKGEAPKLPGAIWIRAQVSLVKLESKSFNCPFFSEHVFVG